MSEFFDFFLELFWKNKNKLEIYFSTIPEFSAMYLGRVAFLPNVAELRVTFLQYSVVGLSCLDAVFLD